MKHLILAFSIIFFISCNKDDNGNTDEDNSPQFAQIETNIVVGTWEIQSFIDRGEDKTMNFESVQFTFDVNGNVIGQNNLFSEAGTWNYNATTVGIFEENFFLQFNGTEPFPDLSENWEIIAATDSSLTLEIDTVDINKTLIFTKQ